MKKGLLVLAFILAAVAVAVGGYYRYGRTVETPKVATAPISRGDIAETVGATGAIEAVTTVQVGTQVSGTIKALYADFNSIVRKGQIVAELDPSLFETQIAQGQANLVRAQADVERLRVALEDARNKLRRTQDLSARKLVAPIELETAQTQVNSNEAQLKSAQAQVVQAQASLNQSQVNLQHTVIEAPIDGIVISRNVDVGQTVAASMQAPTLFVIAADLTKMRVVADIDESDVGRIRPKQVVRFRVDAYPLDEFTGTVTQIRLQPKVVQNVVTYATVIDVPNPSLKLKPGMTATVTIEIARKTDVVRVPNAALRFRASSDIFAALGQPVPPELQRAGRAGFGGAGVPDQRGPASGGAGEGATTASSAGNTAAAADRAMPPRAPGGPGSRPTVTGPDRAASPGSGSTPASPAASGTPGGVGQSGGARGERRVGGGGAPGERPAGGTAEGGGQRFAAGPEGGADPAERRQRFQERMQSMSPEERERVIARMRERGIDPQGFGGAPGGGQAPAGGQGPGSAAVQSPGRPASVARPAAASGNAETFDSLFGPLPPTESSGRVWLFMNGELKSVRVRLGISDGNFTELLSSDLQPGAEVVTTVTLPSQASNTAAGRSPLMGPGRPGQGGRPPGGR